jgi:hypothetical protein
MVKQSISPIVLLILLNLTAPSYSQIHISGPQSGTLIDTVYIVDGEISVGQGSSLTIEPGAIFLFDGAFSFQIQGLLRAIGTEADSIIFRPNSGVAAWHGIKFAQSSSDSCLLQYCLVEGSNDHGLLIQCSTTIDHCTIRWNSGGAWGGGIYVSSSIHRYPVISNCLITENKGSVGGGIGIFPGNAIITNCIITKNRSTTEGGGINIELSASHATIDHCLIAQNISPRGGGIYLCSSAKATIFNCTIVGNYSTDPQQGGGIGLGGYSSAHIVNVIAAYNIGGGINLPHQAGTKIAYGCFYHNAGADFTGYPPDSLGQLVMVNANGDSCDIYHNILMNPLFVNQGIHDYHLQATSPCIDAGDPRTPLDPDSTIADIGAYYFDQGILASLYMESWQPAQFGLMTNYPNPFNASTQITYSSPTASRIELTIYNILGQRIITLSNGFQQAGTHRFNWDASKVASGIYLARVQSGQQVKTIKLILLR